MGNEKKKIQKQIEILNKSIKEFESAGENFLELSRKYNCSRNRVHNQILHRYTDLFAMLESARALSVLGVQNFDLLVQKNEVDFITCIKRYQVLKPMMIKYRDVFDEIICLVKNG